MVDKAKQPDTEEEVAPKMAVEPEKLVEYSTPAVSTSADESNPTAQATLNPSNEILQYQQNPVIDNSMFSAINPYLMYPRGIQGMPMSYFQYLQFSHMAYAALKSTQFFEKAMVKEKKKRKRQVYNATRKRKLAEEKAINITKTENERQALGATVRHDERKEIGPISSQVYPCKICDIALDSYDSLNIHCEITHNIAGVTCSPVFAHVCYKCNKYYSSFKALNAHGRVHTDHPENLAKRKKKAKEDDFTYASTFREDGIRKWAIASKFD